MRSAHRSAAWHLADICLCGALLAAAELEVVLDGLGPECAALAALATLPLLVRRRMPVVAFGCVAVAAPTLDRALGTPWGDNANALVVLVAVASYSLGANAPLRSSLPAVLGAIAWLAALEALWGDGEDYGFLVFLFGVPWLSGRGVRRYRRQAERLRALTARLREERELSERVAVARERHRMAHEAHDAIAHAVSVMALQASGAEQVLEHEPQRARGALRAVQDTGREAVEELREVLGILRSAEGGEDRPPADEPGARAAAPRPWWWRPLVEWGPSLAVLAAGLAYALTSAAVAGLRGPAVAVQLAAAAAVGLRRARPFAALALSLAAYAGDSLLVDGDPGSPATIAAVLICTYSVAAWGGRRVAILGAMPALAVPAAVVLGPASGDAADLLVIVVGVGIPWLAGRAAAAYRRTGEALAVVAGRLARERDARARLAVLEERERVARELHDSVAHAIGVMVLQAGAAEVVLDGAPDRAREAARAIQAVARETLEQIATLLGVLEPADGAPALSPRPGLAGLDALLAKVREAGLPVALRIRGEARPLPPAVDGAAYRVIQEALTNALKHSGGAATTVTVDYRPDGVQLEVVDEGTAAAAPAAGGHGLVGMRERVARHGGRLRAGPLPGGAGFAVDAFLPVTPAPAQAAERVHA